MICFTMTGKLFPNPRLLVGRLRRAYLGALGIEVAFSREGRAGSRIIRMTAAIEDPHSNAVDGQCVVQGRGSAGQTMLTVPTMD